MNKLISFIMLFAIATLFAQAKDVERFKPSKRSDILEKVAPYFDGNKLENFADFAGTSHVAGNYRLKKDTPFLVEGAKAIYDLGMKNAKFWLVMVQHSYNYDTWNLPEIPTRKQMLEHPYFDEALKVPFKCVVFEIGEVLRISSEKQKYHKAKDKDKDYNFESEENEMYEATKFLMNKYANRDITFIMQNWEGDWLFFGGNDKNGYRDDWQNKGILPPDYDERVKYHTQLFSARQRGVDKARNEFKGKDIKCKVYHAVEVNRPMLYLHNIPSLVDAVLPNIKVDLISWSSYDGMERHKKSVEQTAVGIYKGLEIIKHFANTNLKDKEGKPLVYIGEFGVEENMGYTKEDVFDVLDGVVAASYAHNVPWVFYWELYCNEFNNKKEKTGDWLNESRGYWLLRPDGSQSNAYKYFKSKLN